MKDITIGGKKYKLNTTYGNYKKAVNKLTEMNEEKNSNDAWIFHAIYIFLENNMFGRKPFKSVEQIENTIQMEELKAADGKIADLIKVLRPGEGN